MTQQEYQHIKNLSWDLLADAGITCLPVNIDKIASLYELEHILDYSKTRYDNTFILSSKILEIFGYKTGHEYAECLTIRLLAPLMVLKELHVTTPRELSDLTELPLVIAERRFQRYCSIVERSIFGVSKLEQRMMKNFYSWIAEFKKSQK